MKSKRHKKKYRPSSVVKVCFKISSHQKKHAAKQVEGFKCKDLIPQSVFHSNRNLCWFRNVLLPIQKDSHDAHEHIMQASHQFTEMARGTGTAPTLTFPSR